MDEIERGHDRDIARLTATVFGSGVQIGMLRELDLLTERVESHHRYAADKIKELAEVRTAIRPFLEDYQLAEKSKRHLEDHDSMSAARSRWWNFVTGQVIIVSLGLVQSLMLIYIAAHLGVDFHLPK